MTKAMYNKMIKQKVIEALIRANYNVVKAEFRPWVGGLFSNHMEIERANRVTRYIIEGLQKYQTQNNSLMPRQEIENYIDKEIAWSSFQNAIFTVRIYLRAGRNVKEYVQEAKEAREIIKRLEKDWRLLACEMMWKETIGEE
jgi:hypothetical protein